jgi:hypothetical protein
MELHEHYRWQVQHQLMVAGAEVADVFDFDGSDGLLLEVQPDPKSWSAVRSAWDVFAEFVAKGEPPPLADQDVRVRDDPEWLEAAAQYRELRTAYEELSTAVEEAKSQLLRARVAREGAARWRVGYAVLETGQCRDYRRVPALSGMNLDPHRSRGREELRLTLA